jgi:hypothetical protein
MARTGQRIERVASNAEGREFDLSGPRHFTSQSGDGTLPRDFARHRRVLATTGKALSENPEEVEVIELGASFYC